MYNRAIKMERIEPKKQNSQNSQKTTRKKPNIRRSILSSFTFVNIATAAFIIYLLNLFYTLHQILYPNKYLELINQNTGNPHPVVVPHWKEGSKLVVDAYLSNSVQPKHEELWHFWKSSDIIFGWDDHHSSIESQTFNFTKKSIPENFWRSLEDNKMLYVHYRISNRNVAEKGTSVVWAKVKMVRYLDYVEIPKRRYLVKDWPFIGSLVPADKREIDGIAASNPSSSGETGYWAPTISLQIVADWTQWPRSTLPPLVAHSLKFNPRNSRNEYLPVVYTSQLGMTREKLIQLNKTMRGPEAGTIDPVGRVRFDGGVLPLKILVTPISVGRWQLHEVMNEALEMQKQLGASTKDTDEFRHMITETPPVLFAITVLVSLIHSFIDFLAFKSDISYWRNRKSTAGISSRSVSIEFANQAIILAYLQDNGASLLILVPSVVGLAIQGWKVLKVSTLGKNQDKGGESSESVEISNKYDQKATMVMMYLLLPLVFIYSLYSLVFEKHAGFYSWGVGSLASCVYALGFVMMTPQLFINFKLKSVAHLPWNFLLYRAINTFIDDLFAFIIRMPTMHRVAAFRDDVIFVIYIYQRWIYPVDVERLYDEDYAKNKDE